MSTKRSYSRYFIILQEDEKGYSTDANKFPTGYAKVEKKNDRCKVSYYVQNLRKSKEPYYMVLICDRKTDRRLVNLGPINIDDYGRAEVAYEYNVESVANSNIPMESIKGAAIVRLDSSNVNGVLAGFVSGVKLDDWKSYAIIENKERNNLIKDEEVQPQNKKELENVEEKSTENRKDFTMLEEENIFDQYEKNIENVKNIDIELDNDNLSKNSKVSKRDNDEDFVEIEESEISSIQGNENRSEEFIEEVEIDEEDNDRHKKKKDKDCENKCKHENKESDKDKCDEKHKEDNKEKENKKSKEWKDNKHCKENKNDKEDEDDEDDLEEFFESLAEGFEEVKEVCPELGKCKWYKVGCKELENIKPNVEFNKYTMVYYPMTSYYPYIRRHGHYLMGHKCDSKGKIRYIVYAIPGTRDIQEQPFGGATGFVTWVYKDHNERSGNLGYWVMFYDFKNSTVVVPVKR